MTTGTEAKFPVKRIGTYMGRYYNGEGKISYRWKWDDDEDVLGYKEILCKNAIIGHRYEFSFSKDMKTFAARGLMAPKRLGRSSASDTLVATWELDDRRAEEERQNASLKRKRKSELEKLMDPLLDYMTTLNFSQRRAFRRYVYDRLGSL